MFWLHWWNFFADSDSASTIERFAWVSNCFVESILLRQKTYGAFQKMQFDNFNQIWEKQC